MDNKFVLTHLLIMSIITYLIRMLPIVLFRSKIKNRFVQSFLYYVPYAVLAAMTFPAIFYSTSGLLSASIGLITGLLLSYMGKSLLTVASFSCLSVFLTELFKMFL